MEKTFEQIEALWQRQDERLQRIEHVQQESVRRLLHRSITSIHRRFLIENLSAVVLGILVEVFVLSKAGMCFASWNLAVPYLIFNVLFIASVVWYAVWVARFRLYLLSQAIPFYGSPISYSSADSFVRAVLRRLHCIRGLRAATDPRTEGKPENIRRTFRKLTTTSLNFEH